MLINLGIIDFNVGNLRSLLQIFNILPIDFNVILIKNNSDFYKIDKLILPGQSSVNSCLSFLERNDLLYSLIKFSFNKKIMGICAGKHIFFEKSEESDIFSLNILSGYVKKFNFNNFLKIPHIGWNKVKIIRNHFLLKGLDLNYFYFAHSFYILPNDIEFSYGITNYNFNFSSIFINKNILLVQFHPEKSSSSGLKLIYNFSIW